LDISGSLERWLEIGFFILILTKLKVWDYFMAKRLGFDFGVGTIVFLLGLVILKLFVSFFY
jgi:hypothetical protein